MTSLVEPELSYKLVGILYKVYNKLGSGYQEKHYQRSITEELTNNNMPFLEQVKINLKYNGISIGKYYLDFIIDYKIVLEIKITPIFSRKEINQILNYLKESHLKLGILASFYKTGIKLKRILRGYKQDI
ncbi:MAG: GxxExxY protein [bacterium]